MVLDLSGSQVEYTSTDIKIGLIGCPWHGLLTNNTLRTGPGGSLIRALPNWSQPISSSGGSSTQLLRVPGLPNITLNAEQSTAAATYNFNWKNYALVAGGALHGTALPDGWLIYIDGNKVPWLLVITAADDPGGCKVSVKLKALFGRFSSDPYPEINATLAQLTDAATVGALVGNGNAFIERNSNGSVALVHAYGHSAGGGMLSGGGLAGSLVAVYKVSVSGDGSTNKANLGSGITASIIKYKTDDDCYSITNEAVGSYDVTTYILTGEGGPCFTVVTGDEGGGYPHTYTPGYTPDGGSSPIYSERIDALVRIVFSETDAEIVYSATRRIEHDITEVQSYTGALEQAEASGPFTGALVYDYSYTDAQTEYLELKRNGSVLSVAAITKQVVSTDHASVNDFSVCAYDPVAPGEHTTTTTQSVNGVSITANDYTPIVHVYSPQVMGVHVTSVTDDVAILSKVVTPYGSDSAGDGEVTTRDKAANCVGTCDPVEKKTYWYDAGVTDQAGAKVNFI